MISTAEPMETGTRLERGPAISLAEPRDFYALMKPRVMQLVVFTALVGMLVSPGTINPWIALCSLIAIAVGAGASGVLNMWYEADIDAMMTRTQGRPIPGGRVTRDEALAFGVTLSIGSVLFLGLAANWLAAGMLAFTIFFYAVVYTIWLKRATPQNIVIGGAAGAFPPIIGDLVVSGHVGLNSLILFGIIFLWTPPHFWALAVLKTKEYARAGIPMLPVVVGEKSTRFQILFYSLAMAPFAVLPWVLGFASPVYGIIALAAGGVFIWRAWTLFQAADGVAVAQSAVSLFVYSILYLFGLFAVLLGEWLVVRGHAWVVGSGVFA